MAWETIVASFAPMVLDAIGGLFERKPHAKMSVPGGETAISSLPLAPKKGPPEPWSQTALGRSALALASPLWSKGPQEGIGDAALEAAQAARGTRPLSEQGSASQMRTQAERERLQRLQRMENLENRRRMEARTQAASSPTHWNNRMDATPPPAQFRLDLPSFSSQPVDYRSNSSYLTGAVPVPEPPIEDLDDYRMGLFGQPPRRW